MIEKEVNLLLQTNTEVAEARVNWNGFVFIKKYKYFQVASAEKLVRYFWIGRLEKILVPVGRTCRGVIMDPVLEFKTGSSLLVNCGGHLRARFSLERALWLVKGGFSWFPLRSWRIHFGLRCLYSDIVYFSRNWRFNSRF